MITTEQARETLNKYYIEYQWVLDNSKPNYSDDLLDWHSTNIPKPTAEELEEQYSLVDLSDAKVKLTEEIKGFFDGYARLMLIRNGKKQPILADAKFRGHLQSAIHQAHIKGYYSHHLTYIEESEEFFHLEGGTTIDINVTLKGLEDVSMYVNNRAGECYSGMTYHLSKIKELNTIDDVDNYRLKNSYKLGNILVWKMCNGIDYIVPNVIKIGEDGNLFGLLPPEDIIL
jgi:hypothetical protein